MSKLLATLLVLFMAVISANAFSDSVVAGPYRVSFDMGSSYNDSDYTVTVAEPKTTETLDGTERTDYEIEIIYVNRTKFNESGLNNLISQNEVVGKSIDIEAAYAALIGIGEFKEAQPTVTASEIAESLKGMDESYPQVSAVKAATRTIDGTSGGITSMDFILDPTIVSPIETYHVGYLPLFDPSHVRIEISSNYPWDRGTLQLLKTIHVERIR